MLLQLPGRNSRVDDGSVAFCPFHGPCPPLCGLKSCHSHSCCCWFCYGNWPWLSCLIQKQTRAKENRLGFFFFFTGTGCIQQRHSHTCLCWVCVAISVSHGCLMCVCGCNSWHVCLLPPDKGTVQKVIVLPSNHSLHEDLILEELEVFKVSCLFLSPFFYSTLTFIPFLSQNQRQGGGGGSLATTQRPGGRQTKGRVAFRRWMFCSIAQRRVMGNMLTYCKSLVVAPSEPSHMLFYLSSNR